MTQLDSSALDQLFLQARSHTAWLDRPVGDETLRQLYDLSRMGPTGANATPMRLVFVKSQAAKERLKPALAPMNVHKTMSAPVTAIVAFDRDFHEPMDRLYLEADMKSRIGGLPEEVRDRMGTLNGALQGGYLIMAARALGLDVGPMGGFDAAKVDAEFLSGTKWKSLFLLNIGYGDVSQLRPRNVRLDFAEAARID